MDDESNASNATTSTATKSGTAKKSSDDSVYYTNILARLEYQDKHQLTRLGSIRTCTKGELVCRMDQVNDSVYFLLEGRIKICQLNPEGKEVILWFCSPGELFGFAESRAASMFADIQLSAYASGYSRLLVVRRQDFKQFVLSRPYITLSIMSLLGLRLCELADAFSDITSTDVASRVMKLLLKLGKRYGRAVDYGVCLDIPLTHQEMADMIGTSRQTVTTVLGDLRRRGMIHIHQRAVILRDGDWWQQANNAQDCSPDPLASA